MLSPTDVVEYSQNSQNSQIDIKHKSWSQPLSNLRHAQVQYSLSGDVFKLAQTVMLQSYGGFGLDTLGYFIYDIFINHINFANPKLLIPLFTSFKFHFISGYITSTSQCVDLYNACECVADSPKLQWKEEKHESPMSILEKLYQTCLKEVEVDGQLSNIIPYANSKNSRVRRDVLDYLKTKFENDTVALLAIEAYEMFGEDQKFLYFAINYDRDIPMAMHITEKVDVDQLFLTLFPAHQSLPMYPSHPVSHRISKSVVNCLATPFLCQRKADNQSAQVVKNSHLMLRLFKTIYSDATIDVHFKLFTKDGEVFELYEDIYYGHDTLRGGRTVADIPLHQLSEEVVEQVLIHLYVRFLVGVGGRRLSNLQLPWLNRVVGKNLYELDEMHNLDNMDAKPLDLLFEEAYDKSFWAPAFNELIASGQFEFLTEHHEPMVQHRIERLYSTLNL